MVGCLCQAVDAVQGMRVAWCNSGLDIERQFTALSLAGKNIICMVGAGISTSKCHDGFADHVSFFFVC